MRTFESGDYTNSKSHAENALKYFPESFLLQYNLHRSKLAVSGCDSRKVKLLAFDELIKDTNLAPNKNNNSSIIMLKYYLKSILFPLFYLLNSRDN